MWLAGYTGQGEEQRERDIYIYIYIGLIPVNPIVLREILSLLICRDVDNEYR